MKINFLGRISVSVSISIVFLLFLGGCGPGRGDLSGVVTYKGKPLASGYVNVEGSDGVIAGAEIRPDGGYEIKNLVAGPVRITVYSPNPAQPAVLARRPEDIPPPKDASKWFPIPEHYSDFSKSELTHVLTRGPNVHNLDLK